MPVLDALAQPLPRIASRADRIQPRANRFSLVLAIVLTALAASGLTWLATRKSDSPPVANNEAPQSQPPHSAADSTSADKTKKSTTIDPVRPSTPPIAPAQPAIAAVPESVTPSDKTEKEKETEKETASSPEPAPSPDASPKPLAKIVEAKQPADTEKGTWRTWTWTNADGKQTTEAKYVSRSGNTVHLEKRDGTKIAVEKGQLSEEDSDWIKNRKPVAETANNSKAPSATRNVLRDLVSRMTAQLTQIAKIGNATTRNSARARMDNSLQDEFGRKQLVFRFPISAAVRNDSGGFRLTLGAPRGIEGVEGVTVPLSRFDMPPDSSDSQEIEAGDIVEFSGSIRLVIRSAASQPRGSEELRILSVGAGAAKAYRTYDLYLEKCKATIEHRQNEAK